MKVCTCFFFVSIYPVNGYALKNVYLLFLDKFGVSFSICALKVGFHAEVLKQIRRCLDTFRQKVFSSLICLDKLQYAVLIYLFYFTTKVVISDGVIQNLLFLWIFRQIWHFFRRFTSEILYGIKWLCLMPY